MAIESIDLKGGEPKPKTLTDNEHNARLEASILSPVIGQIEARRSDAMKKTIERGITSMATHAEKSHPRAAVKVMERLYRFANSPIPMNVYVKFQEDFDIYGISPGDPYTELLARRLMKDAFSKGGQDAWKLLEMLDSYRPPVTYDVGEDSGSLERVVREVEEKIRLESTNGV